ncbi:MAG: archease [Candidatus Omnitrophica bacterium]|nr:archease [Candidatus Omnitrophota bacterium]MBU4458024.1 archease [Candidatus Omnitrophota bacterium]
MTKPYEIIEHTADVGLKVNGATLKELFENAASGMFDIIAHKRSSANEHKKIQIKKEVEDFEELLVDWLSELLYIFNRQKILFSNFKILELNNSGIIGEAFGEKINPSKNTLQTEIKAVTFHDLKIEEDKNNFSCQIIFDV